MLFYLDNAAAGRQLSPTSAGGARWMRGRRAQQHGARPNDNTAASSSS